CGRLDGCRAPIDGALVIVRSIEIERQHIRESQASVASEGKRTRIALEYHRRSRFPKMTAANGAELISQFPSSALGVKTVGEGARRKRERRVRRRISREGGYTGKRPRPSDSVLAVAGAKLVLHVGQWRPLHRDRAANCILP